ncbi:MAG: D-tyrosyl-tRNA(Tyr) deacylase [Acidobacteria bacterium]|nr:D-tyrosyl-tRNA(Tyr) deacylase [Acidobacteriota bacterium]
MRLVVQRVRSASVTVDGRIVGRIDGGLLVLAGVEVGDGEDQAAAAAARLARLRIFDDEQGRMNLDVRQAGGAILLVSQFTLAASTRKGRRPSFDRAARLEVAEPLLAGLRERLEEAGLVVEGGRFGARMEVRLVNDGPVTFVLEFEGRTRGS